MSDLYADNMDLAHEIQRLQNQQYPASESAYQLPEVILNETPSNIPTGRTMPDDESIEMINRDFDHSVNPRDNAYNFNDMPTPAMFDDLGYQKTEDFGGLGLTPLLGHSTLASSSGNANGHGHPQGVNNPPAISTAFPNGQLISPYYNRMNPVYQPMPHLSESVLPSGMLLTNGNDIKSKAIISKKKKPLANRASAAPPSQPKSRPAFVMKLWSMVNDEANHKYIDWCDGGESFKVFNRESFMKNVLPKYFKHNNFASFVRQLNMYGWHKMQDITSGSLNSSMNPTATPENPAGSSETWQFENLNFKKGKEELLDNIARNKSSTKDDEDDDESIDFHVVLNELQTMKNSQIATTEELRRVRMDNELLWKENYMMRERHRQQQDALDKILSFLKNVFDNNSNKAVMPGMEDLMNGNVSDSASMLTKLGPQGDFSGSGQALAANKNTHNPNHNITSANQGRRARLMLTDQAHGITPPESTTRQSVDDGQIQEIKRNDSENQFDPIYNPNNFSNNFPNDNFQYPPYSNGSDLANFDPNNPNYNVDSPRALFAELAQGGPPNMPAASSVRQNSGPHQYPQQQLQQTRPSLSRVQSINKSIEERQAHLQQVSDWINKSISSGNLSSPVATPAGLFDIHGQPSFNLGTPETFGGNPVQTPNDFNVDEFLNPSTPPPMVVKTDTEDGVLNPSFDNKRTIHDISEDGRSHKRSKQ